MLHSPWHFISPSMVDYSRRARINSCMYININIYTSATFECVLSISGHFYFYHFNLECINVNYFSCICIIYVINLLFFSYDDDDDEDWIFSNHLIKYMCRLCRIIRGCTLMRVADQSCYDCYMYGLRQWLGQSLLHFIASMATPF